MILRSIVPAFTLVVLSACGSVPKAHDGGPAIITADQKEGQVTLLDQSRRMIRSIPQGEAGENGKWVQTGDTRFVIDAPQQIPDELLRAIHQRLTATEQDEQGRTHGIFNDVTPDQLRAILDRSKTVDLAGVLTQAWIVASINGSIQGADATKSFDSMVTALTEALKVEVAQPEFVLPSLPQPAEVDQSAIENPKGSNLVLPEKALTPGG